jgi:opacity protein-like surface antigen
MRAWAALLGLAAATASAPVRADWLAAAYLGAARTHPGSLNIEQPSLSTRLRLHPVHYEGRSFHSPVYYGARLGYRFRHGLGAEAEFIHLKVYALAHRTVAVSGQWRGEAVDARLPMDRFVQRFSISHGLNLLLANLAFSRPLPGPAGLRLALRVGAGPAIPHAESTIGGVSQEGYELGRLALHAAGGAELRLWKRLFWITEYKYTRTRQRVAVPAGRAEALFRTHHLVFGLGLAF